MTALIVKSLWDKLFLRAVFLFQFNFGSLHATLVFAVSFSVGDNIDQKDCEKGAEGIGEYVGDVAHSSRYEILVYFVGNGVEKRTEKRKGGGPAEVERF